MISSNKMAFTIITVSALIGLAASNISPDMLRNQSNYIADGVTDQVSPAGFKLETQNQYRFSEYNNSILFGPYIVDGKKYFYQDNKVLNSELEHVNNKEVEGLHNFYLQTYLDPLFYSPTDSDKFDLSGFERFEQQKMLAKYCDLEYDLIPQNYFNDLEQNHDATEKFLNYASRENAEQVISQNLEATESYSGYVSNFIDLINRDVSGNQCFKNNSENYGLAKATRTPVQYRLDSKVLLNYSSMANDNVEKLLETVESRKKILNSENSFNLTTEPVGLENFSYSYEKVFGPEKAKEKMNERRISEIIGLAQSTDEDAPDETDDAEDDSQDQEAANHTHGENTQVHTDEEPDTQSYELSDLTPEQRNKVRLVDEVPVQYDIIPSCLERDTIPVYGWDTNIYPNIMIGQNVLFQNRPKYLREMFSLSRCPYVELTRMKWYVTDGIYQDTKQQPIGQTYTEEYSEEVDTAEKIFLNNPGEETLSQLSKTYRAALTDNLKSGSFSHEIPVLWRRSLQERSRLHKFESTYDDFYNEDHMRVWDNYFPTPGPDYEQSKYNNFLVLESTYALTFMTWSDSVWRLDQKPQKFAGKLG